MVTHLQDLALARRASGGERAAFDELFDQAFPRLYRFVRHRVHRDEDVTQDICQQTLERTFRKLHQYRGEASLMTWICQIARSEIASYWEHHTQVDRRQASIDQDEAMRHALESLAADPALEPEAQGERRDTELRIQSVLDSLPDTYADALEWKYVDGMNAEEISTRLALSVTAVHSLLARARRAFRSEYSGIAEEMG
jgi:RNA polymerase sigma-70 factor (ECF subfamily)